MDIEGRNFGPWLHIKGDVEFSAAYGCWLLIQIGSVALFLGPRWRGYAARIELFTPCRRVCVALPQADRSRRAAA